MVGTVDVDGLLASMPSHLFDEWKAYALLDPFGTEATFLATAQIVAAIYNTHRKAKSRAISPSEIIPDFVKAARREILRQTKSQTVQEQIAIVEMLNMAFGGRDLRGDNG